MAQPFRSVHRCMFLLIAAATLGSTHALAARQRLISFAGAVQTTYSVESLLTLATQRPATASEAIRLLLRLVTLAPRGPGSRDEAATIRRDPRLANFLEASLNLEMLAPEEIATLVWALAVLQRPLLELPIQNLHDALDDAASELEVHRAAEAQWAWESLQRDAETNALASTPPRLVARTQDLPFAVRLGAVDKSLLSLDGLCEEAAPQRDVMKSGSTVPSKDEVVERRLTAWQSEVDASFGYSGKLMAPRVGTELQAGFSPLVQQLRNVLACPPIGRFYDSVLVNYYAGGKVGMNFHSDPGQGEEWGYSTCVVSVGDVRSFVFRRIGNPSQRCSFALRAGDVVEMFGRCQAEYQHSVKTEVSDEAAGPRMSLVFKRTLKTEGGCSSSERPDDRGII